MIAAFHDTRPAARLHVLVIPKRHIENIFELTPQDIPLVLHMQEKGEMLLRKLLPQGEYQYNLSYPS